MKKPTIIISCEHAVNTVPVPYQALFVGYESLLNSHRGIDFGALPIADYLSDALDCDLVSANATRLLIDCNRSLNHRHCFSSVTKKLSSAEKDTLVREFYLPFRQQTEALIAKQIRAGNPVYHLSIHSFTPTLDGQTRNADIGLLYDPKHASEKNLAHRWQQHLRQVDGRLRVKLNYPYRGTSDGFTTALRKQYSANQYAGLEIECNQALVDENQSLAHLACVLAKSLKLSY